MSLASTFSFAGFLIVALGLAANGIGYLFSPKIMPFHQQAMGTTWEKMHAGIQIMSLNFMKAVAAGFLTASIAMLFLLAIPFRQGEPWARLALLLVPLFEITLTMLCVLDALFCFSQRFSEQYGALVIKLGTSTHCDEGLKIIRRSKLFLRQHSIFENITHYLFTVRGIQMLGLCWFQFRHNLFDMSPRDDCSVSEYRSGQVMTIVNNV